MVEHRSPKPVVGGSSPSWPAIFNMNEKVSFFKKISNFFKEVKQEFVNRTTWPSRELLINSFVTILIFIVFWAVLIGLFDYVFAYLLKLITSI